MSLLERFFEDASDVFDTHVLPRLDDGDLAVLATVNRKMRDVVFESPVGRREGRRGGEERAREGANFVGSSRQAGVGEGARVSVGREDVHVHREGWERGGREVGEGTRMPVGRVDLRRCRGRRPPGGAAVVASERRSVERGTCTYAAEGGHLEVLQWARANGCPWNEDPCSEPRQAATWRCCSGRARTALRGTSGLAPCRERRPPGGAAVGASERLLRGTADLRLAAGGGHLEVLQWARANGCPWDERLAPSRAWRPPGGAAVGACERRSVGRVDLRPGREWRPPGGATVGASERRSVERVDLPRCRGRRPPGGAAVGASERMSVERVDLPRCRERRPPGGATVGASERMSVGRVDLRRSRGRRPPGGAAVGARERRSVGREDLPRCRGRRPPGGAAVGASERLHRGIRMLCEARARNEGARGCGAVDSSCGGRRGGVVARRRCAARRGVCFFSPRHAQSATARRVRVRVALVVDRVVAMRFASLARSSATAPVSFFVLSRASSFVRSSGDAEEANDRSDGRCQHASSNSLEGRHLRVI